MKLPGLDLANGTTSPGRRRPNSQSTDIYSGLLDALDDSRSVNLSHERNVSRNQNDDRPSFFGRNTGQRGHSSWRTIDSRTAHGHHTQYIHHDVAVSTQTQQAPNCYPDFVAETTLGTNNRRRKKKAEPVLKSQQPGIQAPPATRMTRSQGKAPDLPPLHLRGYTTSLPERLAQPANHAMGAMQYADALGSVQPFTMSPMAQKFQPGVPVSTHGNYGNPQMPYSGRYTPNMYHQPNPAPFLPTPAPGTVPPPSMDSIPPPAPGEPPLKKPSRVIPEPTLEYLAQASKPNKWMLLEPKRLLVILDLNGVLLYRTGSTKGFNIKRRAGVDKFLAYLLEHHHVMIWSSMQPTNVKSIVDQLFSPADRKRLIAVWNRQHLRLGSNMLHKVQTYKQLSWVWEDAEIQSKIPDQTFDQTNTVIIDDSLEKCRSEPFNHILVPEYQKKSEKEEEEKFGKDGVLKQISCYLHGARRWPDVSAAIKVDPLVVVKGD